MNLLERIAQMLGGGASQNPPVPPPPVNDPNLPPETLRTLDLIRRSGIQPTGHPQVSVQPMPSRNQWARTIPQAPNQIQLNPYTAAGVDYLGQGEAPKEDLLQVLLHEMSHSGELNSRDVPGRQQLMREQGPANSPYEQRPEEMRAILEANRLKALLGRQNGTQY